MEISEFIYAGIIFYQVGWTFYLLIFYQVGWTFYLLPQICFAS